MDLDFTMGSEAYQILAFIGERILVFSDGKSPSTYLIDNTYHGGISIGTAAMTVGESSGVLQFPVERVYGNAGPCAVTVETRDGDATAPTHYGAVSKRLEWGDGDDTPRTIAIPIVDNRERGPDRTFYIHTRDITGGSLHGPDSIPVTIVDDEERRGELHFSTDTVSGVEGQGGIRIEVVRAGGSSGEVSVHYETFDGVARQGQDYAGAAGKLVWGPGDDSPRSIGIATYDDGEREGDEPFLLRLLEPEGGAYLGTRNNCLVTLHDNDLTPGERDWSFQPGLQLEWVESLDPYRRQIDVWPDGRILVAGLRRLNDTPTSGLIVLMPDGTPDKAWITSFDTAFPAGSVVDNLLPIPGGTCYAKVVSGASFGLVRLGIDGLPDPGWMPDIGGYHYQTMTNGLLYALGDGLRRLAVDGTPDPTFARQSQASGRDLLVQSDGRVIVLDYLNRDPNSTEIETYHVARFDLAGSIDATFLPRFDGGMDSGVIQPDDRIIVEGHFSRVNDMECPGWVRLNPDGTVDESFSVDPFVASLPLGPGMLGGRLLLDPAGKVLVVGDALFRLNPDGSMDRTFHDTGGRKRGAAFTGDGHLVVVCPESGEGAISRLDYSHPGMLYLSAPHGWTVNEDGSGAALAVERRWGRDGKVTVRYHVESGTSTAGEDYEATTGTLTWADGDGDPKVIQVPLNEDRLIEDRESLWVVLDGLTGGAAFAGWYDAFFEHDYVAIRSARFEIVDNDTPVMPVALAPGDGSVGNGARPALEWASGGQGTVFDLYLWAQGDSRPSVPLVSGLAVASYRVDESLASSTEYRWQIVARNSLAEVVSSEWSFTTGAGNLPPELAVIPNDTVAEGEVLRFAAVGSDADQPAQVLSYLLDAGGAKGAALEAATGEFFWMPAEDEGGVVYPMTVTVTDDGDPPLSANRAFSITVMEGNQAPVLTGLADQTVDELAPWSLSLEAEDADLPSNALTFALVSGPDGLQVTASGEVSWVPTEAQGPGANPVSVKVTDDGMPPLSATNQFLVSVREVNTAPVLPAVVDSSLDEGMPWALDFAATDTDLPPNKLTYGLVSGPPGFTVTSSGHLSWTPTDTQGPGSFRITVNVVDNGEPLLGAERTFTLTVVEWEQIRLIAEIPLPAGSPMAIRWSTPPQARYRVLWTSDLIQTAWELLQEVDGAGGEARIQVPVDAAENRFLRVERVK